MKEIIFMLGLPGSGKTDWISKNANPVNYSIVSADEIRLKHWNYDPKHPELIHEECVRLAEKKVYELALKGLNIIMDGGGINNNYTSVILRKLKYDYDYHTKVVFINTPTEICISRNKDRVSNGERFVPIASIINKAYKLKRSVELLKSLADEFEEVQYFKDNHVFFDLDGTLAEYQNLPVDEDGNIDFVQYEVFKYSKPVMQVINKVEEMHNNGKKIYIVSASPNSICNKEKIEWVNKYLPFIENENIYFAGNKNFKYVFLGQLIKKLKLSPNECMVVDDDHNVLLGYNKLGINCVHPSRFLANY